MVDRMQQLVEVDERVLEWLDVDVRSVSLGAPDRGGDVELDGDAFRDEWGVERSARRAACITICAPARWRAKSTPRPSPAIPGPTHPTPAVPRPARARPAPPPDTDYALIFNARFHLVHQTQYLRGFPTGSWTWPETSRCSAA